MRDGDRLRADVDPSRKHDFLLATMIVEAAAFDAINVVDDGYGQHTPPRDVVGDVFVSFCGGQ